MRQRITHTLRYLARLTGQHTARTNAAEGCATLRKRRQDQQHVDEYLQGQLLTLSAEAKREKPGV
ncbi:hypothetical protein GCM10027448_25920 [Nocardioides dilutus]